MSDRPRQARVLLLEVEIRTSERTGRPWYSAWLGKGRLVGFEAEELNDRGHRIIKFYAEEPTPRDGTQRPAGAAPGGEGGRGWVVGGRDRAARPGAPGGRAAELDDDIPF